MGQPHGDALIEETGPAHPGSPIPADSSTTQASLHPRGACVWFTGLSGSGKSTIAALLRTLLEDAGRTVTMLDGDVVRSHLSSDLGFSREDRDTNVRRIGFVAREVVRHGGIAICPVVSPYRATRDEVRAALEGRFIEVYVNTPLEVCEARDVKGLYAQARGGTLTGMTGIDDPYEPPIAPEMILTTTDATPEENARRVLELLDGRGLLDGGVSSAPVAARID